MGVPEKHSWILKSLQDKELFATSKDLLVSFSVIYILSSQIKLYFSRLKKSYKNQCMNPKVIGTLSFDSNKFHVVWKSVFNKKIYLFYLVLSYLFHGTTNHVYFLKGSLTTVTSFWSYTFEKKSLNLVFQCILGPSNKKLCHKEKLSC